MKKFYRTISSLFAALACLALAFHANNAAVTIAICGMTYAVLSVGEHA